MQNFLKYIALHILFISFGNAQAPYIFDHLTTENGLSQNDVNTIYQDKQGFMWFGTHDGLNRYDGYKFTIFKPNPNEKNSISSNLIYDITGDQQDNLWIGTTGTGLNFFDKTNEKFILFKHSESDPNSISSNYIFKLYVDSKNRLWIGTRNGVDMLDISKGIENAKFIHFNPNQNQFQSGYSLDNSIVSVFEDINNQIWVGGFNGIYKLCNNKNGESYFQLSNSLFEIPQLVIRYLTEDSHGNLIIGTSYGLYIYNPKINSRKAINIYTAYVNNIVIDENHIWAGFNNGLLCFENSSKTSTPKLIKHLQYDPKSPDKSLSKNIVTSSFIDNSGIIWVGVYGGGVNKLDLNKKQFRNSKRNSEPNSLSRDNVRFLFEDSNNTLWVGTSGGGLDMSLNDSLYNNFKNLSTIAKPFYIEEIKVGSRKKLLIGAQGAPGLYELDITNPSKISEKSIKPIREIAPSVFAILKDSSNNIWFGTYSKGIYRWLATETPGEYKKDILTNNLNTEGEIANNIIRHIIEDSNNNLWFATANGLSVLSKEEAKEKNPKFTTYKNIPGDTTSLAHNYILTIYEDSLKNLWIGTFGGGLCKLTKDKKTQKLHFKTYSEQTSELPNNVIKGIVEDQTGNLWISSNKGLSRFDPHLETFKNYDSNDGLQSNEFSELARLKRKNGEILFGGVNGFNAFYPEDIRDNKINSETVITNFSIFNKKININEEIDGRIILEKSINQVEGLELKYSENSFSFEFAALHYASPKKNTYEYKLEGFDKNWTRTSANMRFAIYTNVEPGKYTFKVRSSNNDGLWDNTPEELKITISPPFWKTKYAEVLYLLIFLGSLFAFRRFTIIKSTKKHQLELEHLEKEKYEEIHKLKFEFFTNISHEFRTPLTLIKGPLEFLQKKGKSIDQEKINEQYNLMHKNVDYLLRLINQLLDFRKMDRGKMNLTLGYSNIVRFIEEVGEPFQFLSHNKNIEFTIESKVESLFTWFDPDAIEKVVNNLLSNAFKFTPDNGRISINIYSGDDFIVPDGFKTKSDKANYVVLLVKDSGAGIPNNRIKYIFDRFYVDKDIKKINNKGTGIGLAFIKNLVELHQGSIDVISTANEGTSFLVWLPTQKESYEGINGINFSNAIESQTFISQTNAESHAIGVIDDIVDQNISKTRSKLPIVLIVDDNTDIRSFIKLGLEGKYDLYEAENGERAFEFAKKLMPNIVITDVLMPIMDGIEFCNKLKTTQETSHIPVIMLTAKISQEWEKEGLKTGADAYIRKPFDMELLALKIVNILKQREEMRKRFNREITLQPNEITVTSTDERFLQNAIKIVEKHMMNTEFSVELLVKEMALSRSNLHFKIKELTGLSSSEFIRNIRLKRAMQLLEKSDLSVKEIMYMTGFNTASYFSKCFKKQFGVIPSKYVRQIKGEDTKPTDTDS